MCRPGPDLDLAELEAALPGLLTRVRILEAPLLEISSTRLREKIASRGTYRYYLPRGVYKLIEELHLYRTAEAQP